MRIVIHHHGAITEATELALASEQYHHRTNTPPHRPELITFDVAKVECIMRHDYGDSLDRLWNKGEGFINLEADVAPWPGLLTHMWDCPATWCMAPIIVHGAVNNTNFGCVKFGDKFVSDTKGIWAKYPRNDIFDWKSLDTWFYDKMWKERELRPHVHTPPALHFNWLHCS